MRVFTVEKLPDEPIVVMWLSGSTRLEVADDFQDNQRQVAEL